MPRGPDHGADDDRLPRRYREAGVVPVELPVRPAADHLREVVGDAEIEAGIVSHRWAGSDLQNGAEGAAALRMQNVANEVVAVELWAAGGLGLQRGTWAAE